MPDQSDRINPTLSEVTSACVGAEVAGGATRRGFLKLGAGVAVGLIGSACSETTDTPLPGTPGAGGVDNNPNQGNGGSNSQGKGGSNRQQGNGGTTSGGPSGAGGESETGDGGTTAQPPKTSAQSTGGSATGGKSGKAQGGSTAKDKTGAGGASTGGKPTTGGAPDTGKAGNVGKGGAGGTTGAPPSTTSGGGSSTDAKENHATGCTVGTVSSKANAKLPDPFKFLSGTRISKKEDWPCLRAELSAALQACIYGPKMPPPDSLKATFNGGSLSIEMTVGSNKKTLTVKVSGGGSASSPKPALITCGASSLPALSGVATINMEYNGISSESNLGGLVQSLYGNTCAKSGALINWAWGCSRIIDGLVACPEAGINVGAIAVTGCSRCGKGALSMGAFDERVALTLVQEGGSGGTALWRVSSKEYSMGQKIQEATEIVGEAKWQGSDFKSYVNDVTKLAADQHFAVALCAPRAIMVFENDIDWLGPVATYGGVVAGRKVFEALGIADRCGCAITQNHTHCAFPSSEQKYLDAFVNRFLNKKTADTSNAMTFKAGNTKLGSFKEADWIDWDVPTLGGSLSWDPFA